jgi:hypothetical protein
MNYEEALAKAKEADSQKKVGVDFHDIIEVEHQDGSRMSFANATFGWIDEVWCVVWTEHCGVQVFHSGDIRRVDKVKRYNIYFDRSQD